MADDLSPKYLAVFGGVGIGILDIGAVFGFVADVEQVMTGPWALGFIITLSVVGLALTIVVLLRAKNLGKPALIIGIAGIMLATLGGTAGIYHWIARPASPEPQVLITPLPWKKQGGRAELYIPFSPDDNYPQGSFVLDPVQPGPSLYDGDVSIECATDGKPETVLNCTGSDKRTWSLSALAWRSLIGATKGDALADPNACEEINDVTYETDVEMESGQTFCLRKRGDITRLIGLRVVSYPAGPTVPTSIVIETQTWVH
jgi:hypothetical protein